MFHIKTIFYLGNDVNVKDMAGIDQDQEIEGEEGAAAVIEEEIDINPPHIKIDLRRKKNYETPPPIAHLGH